MKRVFWVIVAINLMIYLAYTANGIRNGSHSHDAGETVTAPVYLLSERDDLFGGRAHTPQERFQTPARPPLELSCFRLGPFERNEDAMGALMQLKDQGATGTLRTIDAEVMTGYWVYLPPEGTAEDARRRLLEIERANIDAFLVTKQPMENAISVGVYTDRDAAESQADRLKAWGFSPQIEPRATNRSELWIQFTTATSASVDSQTKERWAREFPNSSLEYGPCQ